MKWHRIETGWYQSHDGNFEVIADKSQQTGRADEKCWAVVVLGIREGRYEDTLRDAKQTAERIAKDRGVRT